MSGARNSTATATTATAEPGGRSPAYVGRFAPTPSGPLHLGSLVAALASYLDARAHGGRWLLRIDDLDQPRVRAGCDRLIIQQLTNFGLEWDGEIRYQSRNLSAYQQALRQLQRTANCFYCRCSRRELRAANNPANPDDAEPICTGNCRAQRTDPPAAVRMELAPFLPEGLHDRWQGWLAAHAASVRDRVLQRRDGIFAYHLAVVVDDAASGVTDVVRGADLLNSTLAQVAIYRALGATSPRYAHSPVVTEADGSKLAKSQHSVAVGDPEHSRQELILALKLLQQPTPLDLDQVQVGEILRFAVAHWAPANFSQSRTVALPR